jgi:GT2 family glycosyltransferase
VLRGERNLGFSGNANRALRATRGRLVLILNDDVTLAPDYFEAQLAHFDDPRVFAVMGSIHSSDDGRLIDAAKFPKVPGPGWLGGLRATLNCESADGATRTLPTLFASGANALMDRTKLVELEYFSEIYAPYYMEDVDLGVRAWRNGWRSIYEPRARCVHEVSTVIRTFARAKVRAVSRRNRWIFHLLHLPALWLAPWMAVQILGAPFRLLREPRAEFLSWLWILDAVAPAFLRRGETVYPRTLDDVIHALRAELDPLPLRKF